MMVASFVSRYGILELIEPNCRSPSIHSGSSHEFAVGRLQDASRLTEPSYHVPNNS